MPDHAQDITLLGLARPNGLVGPCPHPQAGLLLLAQGQGKWLLPQRPQPTVPHIPQTYRGPTPWTLPSYPGNASTQQSCPRVQGPGAGSEWLELVTPSLSPGLGRTRYTVAGRGLGVCETKSVLPLTWKCRLL